MRTNDTALRVELTPVITELRADRIGHGFNLFRSDMLTVAEPERYVASLVRYLADRRIAIEVCLSSNIQVSHLSDDPCVVG